MKRWYVVQIHPNSEALAIEQLGRQAYETYAPQERFKTVVKNAVVERASYLFPGYVFVSFDIERDRWRAINGTRGVAKLLPRAVEIPLPVPIGLVEGIRAREAAPLELDDWLATLAPGDRVELGAASGFGRRVARFLGRDRARVKLALALLGREITLSVDRALLLPAR